MEIRIDVKLSAKDLFIFNVKQVYSGMQGILSIILPIFMFAYAVVTWGETSIGSTLLYIGLGIVFLVYVPISLWMRVNKVINDENNALSKTLCYTFAKENILVEVGKESAEFQWENIYQMKTWGKLLLIYTNRINAYILPLEQVGKNYDSLSKLAHQKLEKHRINMK